MFQRVLLVDPTTGFYRTRKYGFERYLEPVDLGIHLTVVRHLRPAEKFNHHCGAMGFDAISGGGVLAWLMELLLVRDPQGDRREPAGVLLITDVTRNW